MKTYKKKLSAPENSNHPYRGIMFYTLGERFTVNGKVDVCYSTLEEAIAARDKHEAKIAALKRAPDQKAELAEFDPSAAYGGNGFYADTCDAYEAMEASY